MDGFQKFMMTDPSWAAGLSMMQGNDPQAGIQAAFQNQAQLAAQEEAVRQKQAQQVLGDAIAGGITPEAIGELAKLDPQTALKLQEMMAKQEREKMRMQLLGDAFGSGGGAGAADKIAAYGVATGDTSMLPLATFMQGRENRDIDYQRDLDKEGRKEAQQIEKERRNASISGFEIKDGLVPSAPVVNEATKKATALSTYRAKKQSILDMIDKYGDAEVFAPASAKLIKQQFADIRNLERELGNTGVLNVGELPFLEETYASFNPLELTNRTVSKDVLRKNAEQYFADRESMLAGQLGQMGYIDKSAPAVDLSTMSLEQLEAERARIMRGGK